MLRRTFSRSARAASASRRLARTLLRTRPQKSSSHDASKGSAYSVKVTASELERVGLREAGWRWRVTDGFAVTTGKNCERACFTAARAARKLARAAATVWLDVAACSSSAFRLVSANSSHQEPRSRL